MRLQSAKARLLIGAALVSALPTGAALAQDAGGDGPGDIVVTARRVEERLQDVPISITVYNQQAIADRNIVTASDLGTYTPSLSVNQKYGPEKSTFSIRGFNQDANTSPTVGVYFADVVGVRAQGGTTSGNTVGAGAFMDLQNVQVLKGPQGTLFGRNTTGGAVLLVPNRPTDRLEGWVEGQVGNYDMRRGQAVLNVPLAETFKVRLSVDRNKREGYMKNQSGIGADAYNDVNYFAARLGILAELTPELENYTVISYSNSFSNGFGAKLTMCDRTLLPGDPSYNAAAATNPRNAAKARTAPAACNQIARAQARGDGALDVDINNPDSYLKLRQWQIINTTTWQATDNLTIKNILSYGQFRENTQFSLNSDNFSTTSPPLAEGNPNIGRPFYYILLAPGAGENNADQESMTEELQFQGQSSDGSFSYQVGGYIELSRPLGWNGGLTAQFLDCSNLQALQCTNTTGLGNISASATQMKFDNKGLYAQATYKLTSQLSFTGGFRYTFDKIAGAAESTRYQFGAGGMIQICNDPLNFPQPGTNPPSGLVVTNRAQCHREQTVSWKKPTWLVGVDYKPVDDLLLYAKYSRGYRQGGLNFTNIALETWRPEKVDAYEIGAKYSFNGAVRGYFNVAGFYNDFTDQQVFGGLVADARSGIAGGAGIFNAGKSRIQGVEVDASMFAFGGFRVDLGYTYLKTELLEIALPPAAYPYTAYIPTGVVGDPLTLSPKHRLTVSANYTLPVDESVGRISAGATYTYTSKQVANGGSPIGVLPDTNLLNLNLNWNGIAGSPFDVALFGTNVTNRKYPVNVLGAYASAGFDGYLMGAPRMYGLRIRYNFGS